MKTEATINGKAFDLYLFSGKDKENHKTIKVAVAATGISWLESDIFIANFPERGRSLSKQAGYQSMRALG